jgi:hypothetical protein
MRFFRVTDDAEYERVRNTLDVAWGLPNDTGTETCILPAARALRDQSGAIVIPIRDEFLGWEPAASMLPELLATSALVAISESQFNDAIASDVP